MARTTDRRTRGPDRRQPTWEIDCVNCGQTFATMPFDAAAFCSPQCHATARAIRYGRRQVVRFGPSSTWQDEVLLSAVGRVPRGTLLVEIDRRWNAPEPEKVCDHESWNHTWLDWVARNRRQPVSR
jgi:hypothetical protein